MRLLKFNDFVNEHLLKLVSRQREQWTVDLTIKKVQHSLPETKEKQTKLEGPATVGCQGGSGSVS